MLIYTRTHLKGGKKSLPIFQDVYRMGEIRCLRRSELITSLAESLPPGTIHLGCQVLSITADPLSSYSIIQLQNGRTIKAKVFFH